MLDRIPPITFAFLSSFGFSCLDHLMGYLTNVVKLPVFQLGVVATIFLAHVLKTAPPYGIYSPPHVRWYICIRGVLCAVGLVTAYTAMGCLTQSEFMTVYCCGPFATGIMCWVFVGERFSRLQGVCCCISLVGVILITNPFRPNNPHDQAGPSLGVRQIDDHIPDTLATKLIGVGLVMPCLIILGGEMVTMRFIKQQATPSQIMIIISGCPALSSAILMGVTRTPMVPPPTIVGWLLIAASIPTGLMAQLSLTYASQRVSGLKVTVAIYSGLVHSMWIQWAVYGNHPSASAFLGAGIIVAAGLYSTVYGPADDDTHEDEGEDDAPSEVPLLRSPTD